MSKGKTLKLVNVVDVESTCWDSDPPIGEESEIIEIGITVVNVESLERISKHSILVKPMYSKVSPFCTQLTSLTQKELDENGIPFYMAVEQIKTDFNAKNRLWVSWGDYDRVQFERNCHLYQTQYPFGRRHLNLKTLFAIAGSFKREEGVASVLDRFEVPFEGFHHRGDADSWNIANLLIKFIGSVRPVLIQGMKIETV